MEDKAIIERQQVTLDEDPTFQMLAIMADAPLAHFRRVLGKLIDAETERARRPGGRGCARADAVRQAQAGAGRHGAGVTAPG